MTKNAEGVLLKKSKLTTNGKPNLPAPSKLVEGELAINYAEGVETISTKNESGTVVTFSSDDYYTAKKLGSGFTGVNSARTVTDAIVNADWDETDETSPAFILNKPFGDECEYVTGYESTFTAIQTGPNDYGINQWSFSGGTSWKHGDTYRVTINDDVYVTNAVYFAGDYIGLNMEEGAENPFTDTWCIYKDINFGNILSSKQIALGDTVHLKVEQLTCTTKTIDNKYLDTPWEKGEDVGSAKIVANSGITSGVFAISEGNATSAITEGTYGGAHAEGLATLASGNCTHAEGCSTSAMTQGMPGGAHAEGVSTLASGQGAHAEGSQTSAITSSPGAHAEGNNTLAYSQGAHAEGINCIASGMSTHAEGYATSAMTNGMPTAHAEGYETLASFGCAHAEGGYTRATAQYSHAEGERTSATTIGAHAEGSQTQAKGYYSHAEGGFTITNGYYAHAEGYQTSATTSYTHAEGYATLASAYYAHAEGSSTRATGQYSHAEGASTSATSQYSHAEGNATKASGDSSHAEGWNTVAGGRYGSHAEGYNTKATADYNSHAEGYGSIATGNYGSHAEGNETIASSYSSHAEGCATSATSYYSHSEGYHTLASGQSSHAEGYETVANGYYSHTEGYRTIANNYFEHAGGICNISYSATSTFGDSGNTLFSIGNGENYNTRHNAFEIRQNGDIYIVNKAGQDVRLQDEIGNIDVDQVLDETTSASTNPVATKAVYDVYHEFETVVSAAINDLETKKLEESDVDQTIDSTTSASTNPVSTSGVYDFVTSYTPSITVDQVLDETTSASTNPVATKAVYDVIVDNEMVWANAYVAISGAISSHTEDTDVHVTASDKTNWNGKLDATAYTPTDLSNYYQKSETSGATELSTAFAGKSDTGHTHTLSEVTDVTAPLAGINSITGAVGTMAFQNAASYSSATEVNTALGDKASQTDLDTLSGTVTSHTADTSAHVTQELLDRIADLEKSMETIATALVDLDTRLKAIE